MGDICDALTDAVLQMPNPVVVKQEEGFKLEEGGKLEEGFLQGSRAIGDVRDLVLRALGTFKEDHSGMRWWL